MTCHLLPFVSYLDQPHLLRDLVAFRCHRRQWHHGPGGSRFFASADDTGLQLLGRLSCQPPGLTCLLRSPPPLHSHGKNDDHLSDGDRGKGSHGTQDDDVCVSHQPRQIPHLLLPRLLPLLLLLLLSFLLLLLRLLSSSVLLPREGNGHCVVPMRPCFRDSVTQDLLNGISL